MANVRLSSVTKSYGTDQVIHGVDLDIADGDFVVFVGPSGCGKSTLLRMIAGLEEISGGEIEIGGRVVNEVAPARRGVAMVFQTYALYPHMNVYKNMAFGLKQARTDPAEIDRRVRAAAEILGITDYLDRQPRALSGGQRQRVAIGRAIVREPDVFLFDEPLSNLDAALRVQTRLEIARLHQRLGTTMVYVTHDQVEAMTLADTIVVLRDGRVEQAGTPIDLYDNPANTFVAGFIGSPQMNMFGVSDFPDLAKALVPAGTAAKTIGIRPEHLTISDQGAGSLHARLELVENLGEYALAHMVTDNGTEFIAKVAVLPPCKKGDRFDFSVDPSRAHLFDDGGQRTVA